ncbi:MAG: TonB-dependent receptor, partial [Candidatus Eremiobacteraeota bacterium]|nr:TonB-dependent receptor [Candidatus Eremiobacteraeota bacterium]
MPAVAGTTGGIGGRVVDATTQAPLSGTRIEVSSLSGSARTVSDAHGLYTFVSLSPDTYTMSASRDGYMPFTESGITIQADVQQSFNITLSPVAKTIGRIITRGRSGLVRPGQTINLYSVNPDIAMAAQPLAGPGGIDQAYSALAAIPGVYVPQGQQGWYQPIFIRGGDQDQIGYELDGVPINRSYDNAPQSLLTNVGQQELQVYTGGATASSGGQGISGYVNQVVKTGSRTPFGSLSYGVGFPAGYQKGGIEYGGAVGDGRFTYYVAASLSDQFYRYADPFNGVSLDQSGFFFPSFQFNANGPIDLPGTTLGASETRDRETVVNLHYAIPHGHDGISDDLQLLHVESDLHTFTYGSFLDFGGKATFGTTFSYPDQFIYSGQVGAALNPAAVTPYLYPATPDVARSYQSQVNVNLRAVADNGFSLTKLQYQHNVGTRAYVRLLGFSAYSNWFIQDPIPVPATLQYILPEITFGGSISYVNQLSDKHLLTLSTSIASSREYRYTTGFPFLQGGGNLANGTIGGSFVGNFGGALIGSYTDGRHCYNQTSGGFTSCFASDPTNGSQAFLDVNTGAFSPFTTASAGTPAAINGARWIATENGYGGLINQVSPILTAASVDDRMRPNDRLTVDLGARVERYYDRLVNEATGYPARPFWFQAVNNEFCVAQHIALVQRTIDPLTGAPSPCPSGAVPINLSLSNNSSESNSVFEPRVATTYELSPDTTLRASYGTYARPPNASWVQYGTLQQDLATPMALKFIAYGFTSPQHNLIPDISHNVDFSWEQHIHGTDASFKVTPYYRGTMGQFENILLDTSGNESGVNVGSERTLGVEFAFLKGDFARDGLSGLFSLTYNYSRFRYAKFASGFNVLDLINNKIAQYNAYTSACAAGGSASGKTQFGTAVCGNTSTGVTAARCFDALGGPDPSCAVGDTVNPYWNRPVKPLQDPGAAYAPYDVIPDQPLAAGNGFGPPWVATLLGHYKHNRFTVTPSIAYSSGAYYGAPLSTVGDDPAKANSAQIPIPNDFTAQFDRMGAFQQPWRLTGNLQLGYAVTQSTQLLLAMTGLFDSCHQRGYAWDRANFCAYTTLPFGQAPNSSAHVSAAGDPNYKFPYTVQNGNNNTQFLGTKIPFQAYVT